MSVDFAITSKKPTVAAAAVVVVVAVFVVVVIVFVAAAASSSSSSSSLSLSRAAVQHGMDACTMSVPAWMLAPCGWIMAQGIKLAQGSSHGMDACTMSVPAWMLAPCGWTMAQGIKLAQGSSHGMSARTISMPAWMLAPCGWAMAQGIKLAQGSNWLKVQAGSRQVFRSFAILFSSIVFFIQVGGQFGSPEQRKDIHHHSIFLPPSGEPTWWS